MANEHFHEYERHLNRIKANRDDYLARRDRLIDQIRKVFDHVTREGGISLREAHVIDDYGSNAERAKAKSAEADKHWSGVDPERLDPGGSGLSFVDPIGYRYYLPAYMTYCLRTGHTLLDETECTGWNGYESVHYGLNPGGYDGSELRDHVRRKYALFIPKERTCIARFLAFEAAMCVCDIDAEQPIKALRSEWLKYLPDFERKQLGEIWPKLMR